MSSTGNPFFDRLTTKDKGVHGRKAEKYAAKRMNATAQPGSGALDGAKGDFSTADFLLENKATIGDSYSLKLETWAKIYHEAQAVGKNPALSIQFTHNGGGSDRIGRLVCIPEWLFLEMVG